MKLSEVVEVLNATIFTPENYDGDKVVDFAFGSDMMSDALMLLRTAPDEFFERGILLTGLVTRQSVRTAEMLDFGVVLIVRGKKPNDNVYDAAREAGVTLIGTDASMFSASGKLYALGVRGVSD